MMRNVTGKAGELVIVVSPDVWDGAPGAALRDVLAQPQHGLPQDEPMFNTINIPIEAYVDIFKTSRNIVEVNVKPSIEKASINFKRNVHAYTQALVTINAPNQEDLEELIRSKSEKIVGFFLTAERERLSKNYAKYLNKGIYNTVEKHFGLKLNVPPGFNVAEEKENFMWLRFESPEISQGILIYTYPYESDSTFTKDFQVIKRNVVLKNNVPGPREGSFMTTESELALFFSTFKKDGNYASELRGLWKAENDYMGGPFVSLSLLDLLHNRVVTLDAYVYAPGTNKRNLMRQVEAMIYSAEFTDQSDMNKINKQYEE